MTEETVTKVILNWLMENGWKIVCFDFPQSGTGRFLHPNGTNEKNKDTINPDIVAVKNDVCVFLENKSFFYFPDFKKVNTLIHSNDYSDAIIELLSEYAISNVYYGIGYPAEAHKKKAKESVDMVDFIVGVTEHKEIEIIHTVSDLIFN